RFPQLHNELSLERNDPNLIIEIPEKKNTETKIRGRCSKDLVVESVDEEIPSPETSYCSSRLDLGWVIIGNACLDGAHTPKPSCNKTNVLESGRPSIFSPCPNRFHIKEYTSTVSAVPCDENNDQRKETFENGNFDDGLAAKVFASSKDDNKPGPSVEDRRFVNIMEHQMVKNEAGNWEAPLPFRNPISRLPDNREDTQSHVTYASESLSEASRVEIHTFCDASTEAIAAVSYIKVVLKDGQAQVSFVFGKAKLAPSHATTIPRLELCAAVLGVEITVLVIEELAVKPHSVTYYTDSKVTLGYILSETRRFYVYVSNRVQRIRRLSSPDQWRYVATDLNPADLAARSVKACDLKDSSWLAGPKFLQSTSSLDVPPETETFQPPQEDPELRPEITTLATNTKPGVQKNLGTDRFLRFSR
ncbi:hypothetical protein AWC38_SpisGene6700, partial [Paramuricea clavata]